MRSHRHHRLSLHHAAQTRHPERTILYCDERNRVHEIRIRLYRTEDWFGAQAVRDDLAAAGLNEYEGHLMLRDCCADGRIKPPADWGPAW